MQFTIIQYLILGVIQGITEWLPVSSSGMVTLVMSNFYKITDFSFLLHQALFLHLGTFLAALIYFRKDVFILLKSIFNYKKAGENSKKVLKFLFVSTLITGIIGLIILKGLDSFLSSLQVTGKTIAFVVGFFLLLTGIIQVKIREKGLGRIKDLKKGDGLLLGFVQGLASLPGLSRSGITISTLLLRKFDDTTALKLSFLMSLPVVLIGNIFLNLPDFTFTTTAIYGLLASFVFGLLTIHGLIKLSRKINFGWFVLIFAVLMLGSVLV